MSRKPIESLVVLCFRNGVIFNPSMKDIVKTKDNHDLLYRMYYRNGIVYTMMFILDKGVIMGYDPYYGEGDIMDLALNLCQIHILFAPKYHR